MPPRSPQPSSPRHPTRVAVPIAARAVRPAPSVAARNRRRSRCATVNQDNRMLRVQRRREGGPNAGQCSGLAGNAANFDGSSIITTDWRPCQTFCCVLSRDGTATCDDSHRSALRTEGPRPRIHEFPPLQPILNVHSSQPRQLPKKMSARFSSHTHPIAVPSHACHIPLPNAQLHPRVSGFACRYHLRSCNRGNRWQACRQIRCKSERSVRNHQGGERSF